MPKIAQNVTFLIFTAIVSIFAKDSTESRKFQVNYKFNIIGNKSAVAKLWIPQPYNSTYQKITDVKIEGNQTKLDENSNNHYGANTISASWDSGMDSRTIEVTMSIETTPTSIPLDKIMTADKKRLPIPESVIIYTKPTVHIPTDGIIKQLGERITKGHLFTFILEFPDERE